MFLPLRDYIFPGKSKIEDELETETKHMSTLLVECAVNDRTVNHSWSVEYDPAKEGSYLEDYKDFLDWYTRPSHQRKPFYIMEYREGQRVLKREHIVGVSVTKSQREVPVVSTKEDVNE